MNTDGSVDVAFDPNADRGNVQALVVQPTARSWRAATSC